MYATHHIHPCTKYGKPLSRKKYGPDTKLFRQTDRQTDGQTELYLYTPLNFFHGGHKNIAAFSKSFKHALNQSCVPWYISKLLFSNQARIDCLWFSNKAIINIMVKCIPIKRRSVITLDWKTIVSWFVISDWFSSRSSGLWMPGWYSLGSLLISC